MYNKTENLPMELFVSQSGKMYGHIKLSQLAYPSTVKVYLNGKDFVPESFDGFGHPIFSEEQAKIYRIKNFEYRREKHSELTLLVTYKIDTSDVFKYFIDAKDGIERSLVGLKEFNRLLRDRIRYIKQYPKERLNSFVVFGKFLLDDRAQIWSIEKSERSKVVAKSQVETLEEFKRNNPKGYTFVHGANGLVIPRPNSICPCCGKQLTIYDVRDNYCICVDDKFYHESCYNELAKCNEILEIIIKLVGTAYEDSEYQYELLPNGYCNRACCEHIPWFLVHTKHGDIIIGKRKRVISIEWQENFKHFDMNKLFADEDVTKWSENGKRGIHAWTNNNALAYLKKVKEELEAEEIE